MNLNFGEPLITINDTEDFGTFKNTEYVPSDKLKNLVKNFLSRLMGQKSCLVLINEKKILLQQIYKNLVDLVSKKIETNYEYIESIKPGTFSNYNSSFFKEPESVLIILTKKHNKKELRILQELKHTKIKVNVIILGDNIFYDSRFNLIKVSKVVGLYRLMYTILNLDLNVNYSEFSERFVFTKQKVNYKNIIENNKKAHLA